MTADNASSQPADVASANVPPDPKIASPLPPQRARPVIVVLSLALLAGIAAWGCGELLLDHFKPSEAAAAQRFTFVELNKQTEWTNALNGAAAFGILGGLLGIALGIAGGLVRGSTKAAVFAAIAGLILGAAAGALPPFAVLPWHWRHRVDDAVNLDLLTPLLLHMALWSAIGLAAGLAFAIGTSGPRPVRLLEAAIAGLAGAMLGTFIFEVIGAIFFPADHTADPFSQTWITRLLARVCVAFFVGLGAVRALPAVKRGPATAG